MRLSCGGYLRPDRNGLRGCAWIVKGRLSIRAFSAHLEWPFLRLSRGGLFKSFRKPDFDNRLPGHTETSGLFIAQVNHPAGKIDVYSFLFLIRARCLGKIEMPLDAFTRIESFFQLISLHKARFPHSLRDARR